MAYDVRTLYRYEQEGVESPNKGGAVANWSRRRAYRVYMYPMESTQSRNEFGITKDSLYRAIVHDTTAFRIGDRIGDYDRPLYEVVRIRTYRTSQQMEVREIWQQMGPSIYPR